MPKKNEFAILVTECLEPLGPVTCKPMFSGHGVFLDGAMLGLIMQDQLYLKTDAVNRPDYDAAGLEPFSYDTKRGTVATSYCLAPADALEDWEAFEPWATGALAALRRAKSKRPKPKPTEPKQAPAKRQPPTAKR